MTENLSDPDDTLQAQGDALLVRLAADAAGREEAEDLVRRLRGRDWEGDDVLADDLGAVLSGVPLLGRRLPVDLDELAGQLEGDPQQEAGLVDLHTGEVVPGFLLDPGMVGDDAAIDVDEDPGRWLGLPYPESRSGWRDMASFAERAEPPLRDRFERALQGRGAFRRFKDLLVEAEGLDAFHAFTDDRRRGRARRFLADHGIRVLHR